MSPNINASAKPMSDVSAMRNQNVGFRTVIVACTFGDLLLSNVVLSGKQYVCSDVRMINCPCDMLLRVLSHSQRTLVEI